MINGEGWSYLAYIHQRIPRLKFLIAGNIENQLPPVGEEFRNFENSLIVKELAGRNLVNLTYNFRIGRSSDMLWDEWSINPERFKINPNTPITDRNLSYTNATRKNVINLIQDRLPNPVVVECENEKDIEDNTGQTQFIKYQMGTPLIARQSIMEDLDIKNIIECKDIQDILRATGEKNLYIFFMLMVDIVNNRVNGKDLDTPILKLPLEDNVEPMLSSDSEDDIIN